MTPTIDGITTAFADGFVTLTGDEQRLAQTVYRVLADGRPASTDGAGRWTESTPGAFQLPVADAFEVASTANARMFPAVARTPAAADHQ